MIRPSTDLATWMAWLDRFKIGHECLGADDNPYGWPGIVLELASGEGNVLGHKGRRASLRFDQEGSFQGLYLWG
jgi:hypothetical protein